MADRHRLGAVRTDRPLDEGDRQRAPGPHPAAGGRHLRSHPGRAAGRARGDVLSDAGDELDDLRFALVALTNRVLAADRIAPGDDEAVAAVLDRLLATLDLATERLAQGDDERGAAALRTIPLARLFRLGVSLCGKV